MRSPASAARFLHRGQLVLLAWFVGVAAVLILAFAAQLVFTVSAPWSRALAISFAHWIVPFGVFAVGAGLTCFAPWERRRLVWMVPLHLAACALAVTIAGQVEDNRLAPWREPGPGAMRGPPPRADGGTVRPPPEFSPPGSPGFGPRGPRGVPRRAFFAMLASSRWQLHLAVYWVSVSLASAWSLRRRAVERERRALELTAGLSQAKIDALRLQLQPHFLFNTLNAIATLVHRDASAADEMITSLSDLLRLSLETTAAEVPLRRELELLDCYLTIERVRLGDRLRVERSIAPEMVDAAVPPLMLQTLVENAIRHGIEPRRAPGIVTIRAARERETLVLTIADDGIGLPAADAGTERRGIGLANTEARLRELYGPAGSLTLSAPAGGGVRVELRLPWRLLASGPVA